jgi:hypothetical protein
MRNPLPIKLKAQYCYRESIFCIEYFLKGYFKLFNGELTLSFNIIVNVWNIS